MVASESADTTVKAPTDKKPVKVNLPKTRKIVVDTEACGGCLTCEVVCSARHFDGECNRFLSAIRIDADMLDYFFTDYVCKQCKSASCAASCKLDAIHFDNTTGAHFIDKDICVKCGICVKACPFAEAKYPLVRKEIFRGKPVIIKCDLCHGFADGPLCAAVCPKSAISVK